MIIPCLDLPAIRMRVVIVVAMLMAMVVEKLIAPEKLSPGLRGRYRITFDNTDVSCDD